MEGFCRHWNPCAVISGGCCAKGMYGGQPSLGTCMQCPEKEPGKVQVTVRQTDPPKKNLLQKAVSYVKAEVSAVVSSIPEETVARRLEACGGCQDLIRSSNEGELGWCRSCGCGTGGRAELTVKAKMPAATCPRSKWP